MNRMHLGTPPSRRRGQSGDWRQKVRTCALIQVHSHRQAGDDTPTIRSKVIVAAREALGESPGDAMIAPMTTPKRDGPGMQDDYRLSAAGMFRLPLAEFDLDWNNPVVAESIMAEVVAVLDAELGR
jgi:hypothetical protein